LQEQFEYVDGVEVLEIVRGFINDAVASGCAAGAFRVALAAAEFAADRVLAETQLEVVQ
jgi:hypothetical protein